MNVMDVLLRIKSGARILVTMPEHAHHKVKYTLDDGTEVNDSQFFKVKPFLRPLDPGLLPDSEPLSYEWSG